MRPGREVGTKLHLNGNRALGVFRESVHDGGSELRVAVRQRGYEEVMSALAHPRHDITNWLLATQTSAAVHGSDSEPGKGDNEVRSTSATLDEPAMPFPGQGNRLMDAVFLAMGTAKMPEVEAGHRDDGGQQDQESRLH